VDPTQAVEWSVTIRGGAPGILASPVIDQGGFVYVADFHDTLAKLHPKTGVDPQTQQPLRTWSIFAKFCQTPALTQDGLLIVGTSTDANLTQVKRGIRAFHTGKPTIPYWSVGQVDNQGVLQDVGDFLGSPAIICSNVGTTYIADLDMVTGAGRLYKFGSGSSLMAGDWPTFQAGVRRIGKVNTYPYTIAALRNFHDGNLTALGRLDPMGRAVGQATGQACEPNGPYQDQQWPVVWRSTFPYIPGLCDPYLLPGFARAVNGFGDVAGYVGTDAVAWNNGVNDNSAVATYLPTPGFMQKFAVGMNASSTIVGYAGSGSPINVFRWDKSGPRSWNFNNVGAPSASSQAFAYAISDQIRIAGKARFTSPTSPWHAYVTPVGAPSGIDGDLGTLGGLESEAWDVNDDSGTVGWAHNTSAKRRAFYIQIGGVSLQPVNELPRLAGTAGTAYNSEAYSVNRLGQVVGMIQDDSGAYRAFWWKTPGPGTQLTDLTTMVLDGGQTPLSLGWTLTSAVAINDGGVMIGYGIQNGVAKAWIIFPKCQE
jgi:probable HAF family extracellular repeat protein